MRGRLKTILVFFGIAEDPDPASGATESLTTVVVGAVIATLLVVGVFALAGFDTGGAIAVGIVVVASGVLDRVRRARRQRRG